MRHLKIILSLLLALIVTACSGSTVESPTTTDTSNSSDESKQLQIMTTFYPMYEFASRVAGDLAQVELMVTSGSEVHGYEPSAKDIVNIQTSDLFVYANPEMETWVPQVLETVNTEEVTIVEADADVEFIENNTEEAQEHSEADGHHHAVDPHTWLDPVVAQQQVAAIRDALIEIDAENEAAYTENAAAFINELQQLDEEFESSFEGAHNRVFVTQHAAFGYLAERYDLQQYSLAGVSSETEADPKRMSEVVTYIEENEIPVVYHNTADNTNLAETVAREAGADVAMLHSLESLTSEEIDAGEDYLSIMRQNINSLGLSIH